MASGDKVALHSSDGEEVAMESNTHDCAGKTMPIRNVSGKIPSKVIEHCKKHAEGGLEDQDADFVVDQAILSESKVMRRSSHDDGKFSLVPTSKGEGHVMTNTADDTNDALAPRHISYLPKLRVMLTYVPLLVLMLLLLLQLKYVSARVSSTTLMGAPPQHTDSNSNYTSWP